MQAFQNRDKAIFVDIREPNEWESLVSSCPGLFSLSLTFDSYTFFQGVADVKNLLCIERGVLENKLEKTVRLEDTKGPVSPANTLNSKGQLFHNQ